MAYVNGSQAVRHMVDTGQGLKINTLIDPEKVPNYQVGTGLASGTGYKVLGNTMEYVPPAMEEQSKIFEDGYDLGDGMRWLIKGAEGFFDHIKYHTANDETKSQMQESAQEILHGTGTDGSANSGASSGKDVTASNDPTGYDQAEYTNDVQEDWDQKEREFNSDEAQKQRDWEEYMSNTAVQRAVADIKAAGLNPWLALNGGSLGAASTPSGASASSSSGSANMPINYYYKLIGSVLSSASGLLSAIGKIIFK